MQIKGQPINTDDIIKRKNYPVWFFTNEEFCNVADNVGASAKKIFAIGASGDFIFNCLSRFDAHEVVLCDKRPAAGLTIDFKSALFQSFSFEEVTEIFFAKNSVDKKIVYERVRDKLSESTKRLFDFAINNFDLPDLIGCLRKSKQWYPDGWNILKRCSEFLCYLQDKQSYERMKSQLGKIKFYHGDIVDIMKSVGATYDFIYLSNILDDRKYAADNKITLAVAKEKLHSGGMIYLATQCKPKKMIRLVECEGFKLVAAEPFKFSLIRALRGYYSYSYLLFKMESPATAAAPLREGK